MLFGFPGGPESDDECRTRVGENPTVPTCFDLDRNLGQFANGEGLRTSKLSLRRVGCALQCPVSRFDVMGWRIPRLLWGELRAYRMPGQRTATLSGEWTGLGQFVKHLHYTHDRFLGEQRVEAAPTFLFH